MTIGTKVYSEFYKTLHLYLYFFLSSDINVFIIAVGPWI